MAGGWERYIREYNTRRQFLRRAGFMTMAVGAGPTLLAACGSMTTRGRPRPRPVRAGQGPAGQRACGLPVVGGLRHPRSAQGLEDRRTTSPSRPPTSPTTTRSRPSSRPAARARLRHHHLLPGLQAALPGARHHRAAGRAEAAQPEEPVPLLREQGGELLDRSRRHAHGGSVDVGLDRDHDRHAAGQVDAHVVVRPARARVQGPRGAARRSGGLVHARRARAGLRSVEDHEGRRREGLRPAVPGRRPRATASRPPSATPRRR